MIRATIKSKIKIPRFNFQKELLAVAQRIVIPMLAKNIDSNRDMEGKKFPQLEPYTIRKKRHSRPLIETGELRRSFKYKRRGSASVLVYINSKRNDIAKKLQIKGVNSRRGKKFFNFFGITEGMHADIMTFMRFMIQRAIKNAR